MQNHYASIRERIIEKNLLAKDAAVGVVASNNRDQRVDRPNRDIIVTATTTEIDLSGEVVVAAGANTSRFFKLRNIFIDHCYDFAHCVGKLRSAKPRMKGGVQDGWTCRLHIADLPNSPFPNDILALAEAGGIATSIGFEAVNFGVPTDVEAKQYGNPDSIVRKWNWLELSVTMFPCCLSAQQVGLPIPSTAKTATAPDPARYEYLERMVKAGTIHRSTAEALGLPLDKVVGNRRRIFVIE